MNNSLKIGAVTGLIAGIIAGIVATISGIIVLTIGLVYWYLPHPPNAPILKITIVEIVLNLIWGIVLGIIYSKFYNRIPSKGVIKGLVYGMILYLLYSFRTGYIFFIWTLYSAAISIALTIHPIIYGLMLGFLFEYLRSKYNVPIKEMKINKHNVMGGVLPGAIAGLCGGLGAFVGRTIVYAMEMEPRALVHLTTEAAALMTQDMVWGAVFGIFYVIFYDYIPSKGIRKGLTFSMIFYFISSFRGSAYMLTYGLFANFVLWTITGFLHFIALGLVLGALYKPTK